MLEPVYLENINSSANTFKFYRMIPNGSEFIAEYGRIGSSSFQTAIYKITEWHKKYNEKIRKDYVDVSHKYDFSQRLKALGLDKSMPRYGIVAKLCLFNENVIFITKEDNIKVTLALCEVSKLGKIKEREISAEEINTGIVQYLSRIEIDSDLMDSLMDEEIKSLLVEISCPKHNVPISPLVEASASYSF